jgi:acetyl-CoA carboxylase biotin carboxylase subunit
MFDKILIANRGEIAVRIIRACRTMGIKTVAVYSTADEHSLHVYLADESVCIGPPAVRDSYLNIPAIIQAAKGTGCQAIHPGYGFLSEKSTFAKLCRENDLVFIGPSPEIIESMGNKSQARATMMKAGVPVVPGTKKPVHSAEEALPFAREIGWPIMIKASSGGGGKGMRVSYSEADFKDAFNIAQRESVNAFGDNTMYLERAVQNPRHVEVQVIGDTFGNIVALGERDCSIQRNHQKMIEESPCPFLTDELRAQMMESAIQAAKAVDYTSVGTIEFLVDSDRNYYFMEMNTRIQVEHPVTEMVTRIDLVREMIRVAAGEPLSFSQEDVEPKGHAIECRINAEQPSNNFAPSPGVISQMHLPGGNGVRIDTASLDGCEISPYYDSMIAKVIVRGTNRTEAIAKMSTAIEEMVVVGIDTNLDFQYAILQNEVFRAGEADTGFIDKFLKGEI